MLKNYIKLLSLAFFVTLTTVSLGQTTLIAKESTWKYHHGNTDQSTAMTDTTFDDSGWSSADGIFGVGTLDGATITTAINNNNSTYFRKTINLSTRLYGSLELNVVCDDGFIVYLNGTELHRENVGTNDPLLHADAAPTTISGTDEGTYFSYTVSIDTSDLVLGPNYITAVLKNRAGGSSDLGFDLELIANDYIDAGSYTVNSGDDWDYLDDGNSPTTGWNSDTNWTIPGAWDNGPSLLGYGTIDGRTKATTLNTASDVSVFFRTEFVITDTTSVNYLDMDYVRDDGIVIYVNGVEIFRDGIPTGAVTNTTEANQTIGGTDEGAWNNTVIATSGLLHQGKNIIAASVHQVNPYPSSSDISFDLRFQAVENIQVSLERNQYVQNTTDSSVVIRWRTNLPISGSVKYGTTLGTYSSSVDSSAVKTDQVIKISGLSPNTKYYYHLSTNGTDTVGRFDSTYFFKTAPTPGDKSGTVGFWILGDGGQIGTRQTGVHSTFLNSGFKDSMDMILMLGDNAYNDGTDAEFQTGLFNTQLDSVIRNTPMYSTVGNHEVRYVGAHNVLTPETTPYYQIYDFPINGEGGGLASGTESYYSWDYGNVHFMSVNTEEEDLDSSTSTMWSWCESDLQQNTMDWIVVIIHQGPYTKGSHNSDVTSGSDMRHVEFRRQFLPLLERYGVDITLGGHSHSYERSKFVNGHYGYSPTYSSGTHDIDGGFGRMPGSGSLTNDCAYEKASTGPDAGIGAIHCTAGSSSKSGNYDIDHPVMKVNWNTAGSVYIEVNDNKMSWWYLEENGDTTDYFQILKDTDYDSTYVLTDSTVTLTASWPEGPYLWSNGATTRSITTTLGKDSTFSVQNIAGSAPCMTDTFNVDFPSLVRYPFSELDTTGLTSTDADGSSIIIADEHTTADANGWYYYYNAADSNALIFAARNSGNTLPIDNVINRVEIRKANLYDRIATGTDSFRAVLPIDWNIVPISQPNGGMDIKFYFDPADMAAFTAVTDSISGTNADLVSSIDWFKASQGSGTSFLNANISVDSVDNFTDLTSLLVAAPNYTTGVGSTDGTAWMDQGNGKNYIQFNGLTSFSGGTMSQALFDPTPVPVEWLAFNASWIGTNAQLIWQTASEQNSDYFAIERLTEDGSFIEIGRLAAAGSSNSVLTYQFEDISASQLRANKLSYRIKQVDFDGGVSYSEIRLLTKESMDMVSIYPNPAQEKIQIELSDELRGQNYNIEIFNLNGDLVLKERLNDNSTQSIELTDVVSGHYVVVIRTADKLFTYRLIKE
jgi:hypothetical protein